MRKKVTLATLGAATAFFAAFPLMASPLNDLKQESAGVRVYSENNQISRLYGSPMSFGGDAYQSADKFVQNHADVLGVRPENLRFRPAHEDLDIQPLMLNRETGEYKLMALYYDQIHEGMEVFGGGITLVVRNEPGFPLVEVVNNIKNLTAFEVPAQGTLGKQAMFNGDNKPEDLDDVRQVIFVNPDEGEGDEAVLAFTYIVTQGDNRADIQQDMHGHALPGSYDRKRVWVDAQTGVLLKSQSLIRTVDVVGNVKGWATEGLLPDSGSNPPVLQNLPRVWVDILSGNRGETDENGDFNIANGGGGQVTVRSEMHGPSLSLGIDDQTGADILVDQNVTPPGPADFVHNSGMTEFDTSEVNVMLKTSEVHTFLGDVNPTYPSLNRSFRANVNLNSTCNAFYDGSSINFYRVGGGCVNTGYSTVVYHEYGHKIVDDGRNNPSGDYHEGMADCVSMVLTDDPVVGADFFGPGTMIRTGDNNRQYPCSGAVHFCGQVISGAVWHTRDEMAVSEPVDYQQIMQDLTINSILLSSGGISPAVTIDFLILDDDDSNIGNGTPHYNEIDTGFSLHNMDAPPLDFLDFDYPNGRPTSVSPDGGTTMRVDVTSNVSDPEPGTGMLHVNDGNGWVALAMNEISDNVYDAVFPTVDCPSTVSFYVSVETTDSKTITDPDDAPSVAYSAYGASYVNEIMSEDFQNANGNGWTTEHVATTDGQFEFGVPQGGGDRGDPRDDFDGSGACALTDNVAGNSDVDGGPTRIISPSFNLSGGTATVDYAYWFTNDDNDGDRLTVDISNDDGSNWTSVRSYSNGAGWRTDSFNVSDFIAPSATMKVRFSATDNPNDSVTEAAVDALKIVTIGCGEPGGLFLTVEPMIAGEITRFIVTEGDEGSTIYFAYSLAGLGDTVVPPLNVTLGIKNPKLAGTAKVNVAGFATLVRNVPDGTAGTDVWVQAAAQGKISNIANQVIQ